MNNFGLYTVHLADQPLILREVSRLMYNPDCQIWNLPDFPSLPRHGIPITSHSGQPRATFSYPSDCGYFPYERGLRKEELFSRNFNKATSLVASGPGFHSFSDIPDIFQIPEMLVPGYYDGLVSAGRCKNDRVGSPA